MTKYLAIDIGGTNVKSALLDQAGNILSKEKMPTAQDKQAFLQKMDQLVKKYASDVQGIAFCAPGKIEETKIRFGGSLPFLDGIDFAKRYGSEYRLPVAVINDGKASVLAENWLGSLKDEQNCIAITLGTAVGGGIIVNGRLLRGVHYQAGELSFMIHDYQHAKDMVGNVGGSDSAVGLVEQINQADNYDDLIDGLHAFSLIKPGNPTAIKLFQQYCLKIAILILNIQSVIDVGKVAIGGGISAQPVLINGINEAYDHLVNKSNPMIGETLVKPEIVKAHFQNDANLFGALDNLLLQINHEDKY
ncbi:MULTISPECIES: ROK family protein [Lactobacillus]|uniref:ROK family protein n=1 Tax=Lactobacillus xujianguonis TaxID=2495899 RepID=A0A437SVZ8_9LACO|nr:MULTISPECIES: ROK family protein [Lactobacillus]RVU71007.1 ROK family protein [Lactobacillus xujianguonis]RVU73923.1 ROK family protein [Lactobacillus xujianguonis]